LFFTRELGTKIDVQSTAATVPTIRIPQRNVGIPTAEATGINGTRAMARASPHDSRHRRSVTRMMSMGAGTRQISVGYRPTFRAAAAISSTVTFSIPERRLGRASIG
jgi:hypothetical protein